MSSKHLGDHVGPLFLLSLSLYNKGSEKEKTNDIITAIFSQKMDGDAE